MGSLCDYCGEHRSMVYCRSDSAALCLSCDRNVHSANALSRRHTRTLLCDRCSSQPAMVRCLEENASLCQNCDWNGHSAGSSAAGHKRQNINCYSGCPSSAELSRVWSFILDIPDVAPEPNCEQIISMMSISDGAVSNGDNAPGDNGLLDMASATRTEDLNNDDDDKQKSVLGSSSEAGQNLLPRANEQAAASVDSTTAKMSSEDMEMGNESESDLEVQNQEIEKGDGHGKEIVQVDEEPMDGSERKKEEESAALNKDKEDGDAKTGRKEMAARSEMWNHFTKVFVEGVLRKGKCKYCKREIKAHAVTNGTSALKNHFGVCKRNPHIHLKDPKQGVLQVTDFVGCWKFDPDKLRAAFSQMIIEDELPFAFGEKSGFKKFMAVACPRFKPPSRRTCTRDAVGTYYEEKAKLKLFFQEQCERVCITTDCWTSQQQDSYMTVTAHFIDKEWKLHKKIINFFKIKGHRGDDIGKHLLTCLMEWGLDKVMTITVDNASSNDGGIGYVRKHMKSLIAGGKYLHMRCAAHIVNLIVSDGLKEVDVSVKRVRAAVRYVKNGTTRLDKFKECADLEKVDTKAFLNLDVCTRWNSTHDMLKAAIIYEKVFARYADEDPYFSIDLLSEKSGGVQGLGVPEELDWDNAKKMAEFLGHFADLTVRVSASLNVTANTFFHEIGEVNLLVRSWLESEDSLQRDMGKRMKDKYDKYWGKWHEKDLEKEKGKGKEKENINLMIFMAAILDPRYKLSEYTELAIGEMYGEGNGQKVWSAINKCLYELFEEYRALYAPVASDSPPQSSDAPRKESGKGGSASMMKELIAKKMRLNTGASNSSKSELEKYLAEDCEDIESKIFDILDWWKTNSSRFPILAQLAHDILAIPISTVASESAFSTGGRVLDDFRTSLTPFMVEAIVCTQDWLRRSTPINIQENTEELAKLEEELIKEFKNKATIDSKQKNANPSQPVTNKAGPSKSGPKAVARKTRASRKKN